MWRALKLTLTAAVSLAILAGPVRTQEQKPASQPAPAAKPAVDPNAVKYSTEKIYVPPGAVRSVQIGNFYLRRKEYKGALSRFKEAAAENSSYAPAYLGMGKVYEQTGLKQKALEAYKQYLDGLPSEKDAEEAKNVQRAVARLERELKTETPPKNVGRSKAEAAPRESQ